MDRKRVARLAQEKYIVSILFITTLSLTCISGNANSNVRHVRLGSGTGEFEGLVEVSDNTIDWKYVCGSDNFDINDAIVICRQLGYPGTNIALTNATIHFHRYQYPMAPWAFTCRGDEHTLNECGKFNTNCSDQSVAGAICYSRVPMHTNIKNSTNTNGCPDGPNIGLYTGIEAGIFVVILVVVVYVLKRRSRNQTLPLLNVKFSKGMSPTSNTSRSSGPTPVAGAENASERLYHAYHGGNKGKGSSPDALRHTYFDDQDYDTGSSPAPNSSGLSGPTPARSVDGKADSAYERPYHAYHGINDAPAGNASSGAHQQSGDHEYEITDAAYLSNVSHSYICVD